MLSIPVVIAVSVGCSALLIVGVILGVAVWWRTRQDRLSLAVAQAHHGTAHQEQVCNSLATDSPINSTLPTYPYGVRNEWAQLASQETFQSAPSQLKTSPPALKKEKSKSIRRSISKSLSKSLSIRRSSQKPIPLEPLPNSQPDPYKSFPDAKEKEPKSAIAGFSELPTETTPRNTPERERDDIMTLEMFNNRPGSTAWPLLKSEQRLSSVAGGQPAYFDHNHTRLRNGSITAQTAGTAPDMPMPAPPRNVPQSYQLSREDSLMNMSSMSLETANSSILDDGMRRSMSVDPEFNYSPSLPPCPTFTPFSPYDIVIGGSVARDCASHRRTQSQRLSSSTAHLTSVSMESGRDLEGRHSPRRSLTTREVSPQAPDWSSRLPRRSESVLSSSSSLGRRPASSLSSTSPKPFYPSGQGLYSRQDFGSQSHRQERYSMYEKAQSKEEQNIAFSKSVGDRPKSIQAPSPRVSRESLVKAPLPSAMKSTHNAKKGHRRQNCVRISIHPPITFGGPAFSPMLEEPEEVLDLENDLVNPVKQPQPAQSHSNNHSAPRGESRERKQLRHSRHRSTSSIQELSSIHTTSPGTNSRIPRLDTSRKRPHSRTSSVDDDVFTSENHIVIPNSMTSRTPDESQFLSTPSPERHEPLWSLPRSDQFAGSSPKLPANASTGSPRRAAPKGPRNQPERSPKKVATPPSLTIDTSYNSGKTIPAGVLPSQGSPRSKNVTRTLSLVPSPSKDVRKSITLLRRMNSEACDEDSRQYRRMGRNASITIHNDNNIMTPPGHRSSVLSNDSLTIWEDASEDDIDISPLARQKKQPFRVLERIDSEGTAEEGFNSTTDNQAQPTIRQVPPSSSIITIEDNTNSDSVGGFSHKLSNSMTTMQTPNRKARGYVSTAPTPGSLYDGDGFLKE